MQWHSAPKADNETTQSFQLSTTVSYIFQDENELKGYEPPPPPVLFKMPYDVFYPFLVNAAAGSSAATTVATTAWTVALLSAIMCIMF